MANPLGIGSSSTSGADSSASLSSTPFSFKLDNIKRLSDDGSGYHAWSKQVSLIITSYNCSWCHSKGKPYQGHTFKTCRALKEHNASKLGAQNSPSGKEIVPYRAATVQELFDNSDNGVAMVLKGYSSILQNSPCPKHPSVSANYTTYESVAM
ncbi:hypothetical protein EV426DRAFT_96107 [Tirmania nivea]|nr:hypothetical protein EV426DRAFT_96107 [Tirmania nivea]